MDQVFMTRKRAAELLCVDTQTIDDWRSAGKLPSTKNGSRVLIPTEAVKKLIASLQEAVR